MSAISAIWKNKDIRNRILFTLFAFLIYRLGCAITVPDVNTAGLVAGLENNSLFAMMSLLGGGGLERFSIFALGVTPYITASIIIQLLSMDVIPYFTELSKSGVNGRKKLDSYTRYMAVVFAFIQSISFAYSFNNLYSGLFIGGLNTAKLLFVSTIFTAGTMFLVWLGDQISAKGVGNGISMVIMAGIVGRLPSQITSAWETLVGGDLASSGLITFIIYILIYLLIIIFVTLINTAERKIPIQYTSSSMQLAQNSRMNYLPLKINSASVIPVIFASSIMLAPIQIASFFANGAEWYSIMQQWLGMQTWYSLLIYAVLIVLFTFFYAQMQINPEKVAENLGKSGAYIPSVRPGKQTEEYISQTLDRITVLGSVSLMLIAVLPHLMPLIWPELPSSMALGGTGLIIVVGVALETVKQIQGLITQKSYKQYY